MRSPASRLLGAARAATDSIVGPRDALERQRRNVDLVIAALLHDEPSLHELHDPVAFVDFLRSSFEPTTYTLDVLRDERAGGGGEAGTRLTTFLDALASGVPAAPVGLSVRLARLADDLFARSDAFDVSGWSADVGLHARVSSSTPWKGRLLAAAARYCRASHVLELGTAYGISASYLLDATGSTRLTTVELNEPQFSTASAMLGGVYGDRVDCRRGLTSDILPQLVEEGGRFDVLFHDAMHSGQAYLEDFEAALPALAPGALVIVDDIAWGDERFTGAGLSCHDGWLQLVASPGVVVGVEVDANVGVLLLR